MTLRPLPVRVLVVDHEAVVRETLRRDLSREGFDVHESTSGHHALTRVEHEPFDLLLLDLALPEFDGLTLCRAVRSRGRNRETPIVIITARRSEADRVLALESGADDYLTKPFTTRELMATLRAVLRRAAPPTSAAALSHGELSLDAASRVARLRGEPIGLTRQEFDLLALLAGSPGTVFSRCALLSEIWRKDHDVTVRTVDAAVSRLRRKIGRRAETPELIGTVWGAGYRFRDRHP